MFVVEDRTKQTLYPIIEDNVAPKTLIITDCYSPYKQLDKMVGRDGVPLQYKHLTVNHSKTFKDPITSELFNLPTPSKSICMPDRCQESFRPLFLHTGACTNRIEGYWKHAQKSLPYGGTKKDLLPPYLARFIWFMFVKRHNLDPFDLMLECIKNVQYID